MSVFAAFGVVAPAEGAVDYFLEIDGVQGESQDAKFKDAIDVLSSPGAQPMPRRPRSSSRS